MHPAPQTTGLSATSWYSRLLDALVKFTERRALREMLELRSDRLLADAGFSRAQLAEEIKTAVDDYRESRKVERQLRRELAAYSDSELSDIGIGRGDIRRLAREQAQQMLEARRLVRLGAEQSLRSNANDNPGRRPAATERAA